MKSVLTKIALWLAPMLLGIVSDSFERLLRLIDEAERRTFLPDNGQARRDWTIDQLGGWDIVPESVLRIGIEGVLILYRLGLTPAVFDRIQEMANNWDFLSMEPAMRRLTILNRLKELFPDLPERLGRLAFELVEARLAR
jgi:hypothetical protein